jgi:hypothetical protein
MDLVPENIAACLLKRRRRLGSNFTGRETIKKPYQLSLL